MDALDALLNRVSVARLRDPAPTAAQPPAPAQKEVIRRGFGESIARSVPPMGVRQFDEDAREIGTEVINTRQTSGGFHDNWDVGRAGDGEAELICAHAKRAVVDHRQRVPQ